MSYTHKREEHLNEAWSASFDLELMVLRSGTSGPERRMR